PPAAAARAGAAGPARRTWGITRGPPAAPPTNPARGKTWLSPRAPARRWEPLGVSARRGAPGHGPIAMGQIRTGSRPGSGELAFAAGHALTRTRRGHDRVAGDHHAGPRLDKRRGPPPTPANPAH